MKINYKVLENQPALLELLEVLMDNQHKYMSTLDLLTNGILSPAAGIARLKQAGAIIKTITRTVTDSSGRTRKRIAHYKIVGWV